MNSEYNIIDVVRCRASEYGTFGKMFVNDSFQCYTLEPAPSSVKIKPYPIPVGAYDLLLNVPSPKYRYRFPYSSHRGCVPRLVGVPGFDGILIHIGNFVKDTLGCILVGERANLYRLFNSTNAYTALYSKISKFNFPIRVRISSIC